VLGVGGAAAVAEEQDLAAAPDRFGAHRNQPAEGLKQGLACRLQGAPVAVHLGREVRFQVDARPCRHANPPRKRFKRRPPFTAISPADAKRERAQAPAR